MYRAQSPKQAGKRSRRQEPRARARDRLDPESTFYALRDSCISRAIEAGVQLTVLAESCGTSVCVIEKTYPPHIRLLDAASQPLLAGLANWLAATSTRI